MARRQLTAALAALLLISLATPTAPTRAAAGTSTAVSSTAGQEFDSLTVTFAYATRVGEALSSDGRTREIEIPLHVQPELALASWEQAAALAHGWQLNAVAKRIVELAGPELQSPRTCHYM